MFCGPSEGPLSSAVEDLQDEGGLGDDFVEVESDAAAAARSDASDTAH